MIRSLNQTWPHNASTAPPPSADASASLTLRNHVRSEKRGSARYQHHKSYTTSLCNPISSPLPWRSFSAQFPPAPRWPNIRCAFGPFSIRTQTPGEPARPGTGEYAWKTQSSVDGAHKARQHLHGRNGRDYDVRTVRLLKLLLSYIWSHRDIHPSATLTRIYFENIFCLDSTASHDSGIKVALGDSGTACATYFKRAMLILSHSDGPETTQMIIFARPNATELQLIVARITPVPPPPSMLRLRRPDDPTPRRLPLRLDRSSGVSSLNLFAPPASSPIMEAASASASTPDPLPVGSCRITDMPPRGSKDKERAVTADEDVFEIQDGAVENKGNRKRASDESDAENQMEQENKTVCSTQDLYIYCYSQRQKTQMVDEYSHAHALA